MAKTKTKKEEKEKNYVANSEMLEDNESNDEKEDGKQDFSELVQQTASEWEQGWWFMKPKWDEWQKRLQLYNNQKRDKEAVGDTTLFSVFQTVLASLYEDRLAVSFSPREIGDDEQAENLEIVADYDYDLMDKDVVDYEWDWEAAFFGRGLLCVMDFDRDTLTPSPYVWNRMTTVRDPEAASIAGDRQGRGASRYIYRELRLTKQQMKDHGDYFNLEQLKKDSKESTKSPLEEYRRQMAEAQGLGDYSQHQNVEGDNSTYRLREGFTHYKGKLCFVTTANNGSIVVRYQELDRTTIPIVDRVLFPIPNSFDSVSIPDLVEDKQRARAVALNLSLKSVKANLHPMYLFDKNKIDERTDFNFEFNKFIGTKGNPNGAVVPMQKDQVKQDVSYIMDTLDIGAQRATGTPDIKQGARPDESSTATRDQLVSQGSESRYGLAARIFGWSERRFWEEYYRHLRDNMEDGIDEKVVRTVGSLGASWRSFRKSELIVPEGNPDPDIKIESRSVADARKFNEARSMRDYILLASNDPTAQIRSAMRHYGKLIGMKQDLVEQIYPPTVDELRAEEENQMIMEGKKAIVLPEDDHYLHLQIHNKLPESPYKTAHINAHKKALVMQKVRPDVVPPQASNDGQIEADQLPNPVGTTARRSLPTNEM